MKNINWFGRHYISEMNYKNLTNTIKTFGGTIEGMHDPKFKRIGTGALACAIASIVIGIFCVILVGGI